MAGTAIDFVTRRKGEMINMEHKGDRTHLEFHIPSRGIIGLRTNLLTATQGESVMSHRFLHYDKYKGPIESRINGSLIAMETGTAFAYSLGKLSDRGRYFIEPQDEIYEGQVCGESNREGDLVLNLTKPKKLTNMRASGSDDKIRLSPAIKFSLEEALEYIQKDEYVEVTPKSIRLRKIKLSEIERKRSSKIL
jgi:GTP-binding protein